MSKSLTIGKGSELPLQASKWLDLQALIDENEMESLILELGSFHIFKVGMVCGINEGELDHASFLSQYASYVNCLKNGLLPDEKAYRPLFSSVFTVKEDHLFQINVGSDRRIIRVAKPVVQLQVNQVAYSPVDQKFRALVFGRDSILWGIQFSFPQLFQDPATKVVYKVNDLNLFPNAALFKKLQLWMRQHTTPTPFLVDGLALNASFRLGKSCLPWINNHPQLREKGITVATKQQV